jgi:TonB family protein
MIRSGSGGTWGRRPPLHPGRSGHYVRYFSANTPVRNMKQETDGMRRRLPIAVLALFTSTFMAVPPTRAQQDQPESKRKLVTKAEPTYPGLARSARISGSVRIEAVVAPNGAVKSTTIIGGHPDLAQSAQDAVRRCKWEAAPRETREVVIIAFRPD